MADISTIHSPSITSTNSSSSTHERQHNAAFAAAAQPYTQQAPVYYIGRADSTISRDNSTAEFFGTYTVTQNITSWGDKSQRIIY
jgi:hypothetical protein